MKILHVVPAIAPRYGGPSRAAIDMCRGLRCIGVDAEIATTNANGKEGLGTPLGRRVEYDGVPVTFFKRQLSERFKFSHPLSSWLDKTVAEFDLVHIHAVFSHSSLAAARAARRSDRPYILRPLGTLEPWSLRQRFLAKSVLWRLGVKRMIQDAAAIHYTTSLERQLTEERLGVGRGVVVPLGISDSAITRNPPERTSSHRYILFLSRLHPKKSPELLLDAFSDVVTSLPEQRWRLIMAGSGTPTYESKLRRKASEGEARHFVDFVGWVDGTQKQRLLQDAELFVLPSHQENFGISIVEAMAHRVPVILSDKMGLASEVQAREAGWVVPLSQELWAKTLRAALGNPEERARRGRNAFNLVCDRFLLNDVARRLKKLYDTLVSKETTNRPAENGNSRDDRQQG